jgi:hypothetical protein
MQNVGLQNIIVSFSGAKWGRGGGEANDHSLPGIDSTAGVLGQLQFNTHGGIITSCS